MQRGWSEGTKMSANRHFGIQQRQYGPTGQRGRAALALFIALVAVAAIAFAVI
jgi:hypothetical protein